jgi:VanZ family protein
MNPTLEKWAFRVAALCWMGLVWWLSSKPGSQVQIKPPLDKAIHAAVFGVLGYFLALGAGPRWKWHAAWMAIVGVMGFGAIDEFHQSFSPGRSMGLDDWFADAAGGVAAAAAWLWAWAQGRRAMRMEMEKAARGEK